MSKELTREAALAEMNEIDRKYHDYGYAKRFVAPGGKEHRRDLDRLSYLREFLGLHYWQRTKAQVVASSHIPEHKHRKYIKEALTAGKSVPAAVLADYPDLQERP